MEQQKIELPPKYYLDNFRYLLRFVQDKYASILNEAELLFLEKFNALPEDAQCLFVRFCNRRGAFFKLRKLNYSEIADIPACIETLLEDLFIEPIAIRHFPRAGELLEIFTKAELLAISKTLHKDIKGKASVKKEELLDWFLESIDFQEVVSLLENEIIKVNFEQETMMLKFLFFGNRHAEMTEFVMRDLGIRQYQEFDEDKLVAQFATRQEAEDRLLISIAKEDFFLMQEANTEPIEMYNWFIDWSEKHRTALSEVALPSYERLMLRVGLYLERQKLFDHALAIFRLTNEPPSRERQVRILYKTKNIEEARVLCQQISFEPKNADEHFFAIDFVSRLEAEILKKRTKKSTTQQLHKSESILIDVAWKYQVEAGTIDYYVQQGSNAIFSENHLWRSIFGLLFWDIVFDTDSMAIHHPLQRTPSDLYKPQFWEKRRNRLIERLELLENQEVLNNHITQMLSEKAGSINPLIDWFEGTSEVIRVVFERIPIGVLGKILLEMAKNMRENTHGFPDLFTWTTDSYEFIEVKSPTDNLSAQQLFWLHFFEKIGLKAKVLRVGWKEVQADYTLK